MNPEDIDAHDLPAPLGDEPDPDDNYERFVAHVAEAAQKRDPSDSIHVAQIVLVATKTFSGDVATACNGEPYVLDRVHPSVVIRNSESLEQADHYRETAARTLARQIDEYRQDE